MPTELISIGPAKVLTQNQVYAVPAVSVSVQSTLSLESSLTVGGTFTAFNSPTITGAFVRCTTGSPTVTLRQNGAG